VANIYSIDGVVLVELEVDVFWVSIGNRYFL